MKIAVASEGNIVTAHFGYCENFNVFETENNKIISSESVPSPGHKPGLLPKFLHEMGVNVIISGGMGAGAIEIFNENNIQVITGVSGKAEDIVKKYLEGEIEISGDACREPGHHDGHGH